MNPEGNPFANLPPELAEIVTAWEHLDESTKAKILSLIRRKVKAKV